MLPGFQPWVPGGHRAWRRWTVRLRPEPEQRALRRQGLQAQRVRRQPGQRAQPGLELLELRLPELQRPVLPEPWVLRGPERVLRDVILPTGQAPWARLPELRP